jgi:hypothetical protein
MSTRATAAFTDLRRMPDLVRAFGADGEIALHRSQDGVWAGSGVVVGFLVQPDRLAVRLRAEAPVARLHLRWHAELDAVTR